MDSFDYYNYNPELKIDSNVGYDQKDHLFIIDGKLNLLKIEVGHEPHIEFRADLSQFDEIVEKLNGYVRHQDFVRLGISVRALCISGTNYSVRTGFQWNYEFKGMFPQGSEI